MKDASKKAVIAASENPVYFHLVWLLTGLLSLFVLNEQGEMPDFLFNSAFVIPFLIGPALCIKVLNMGYKGMGLKFSTGHLFWWLMLMALPIMVLFSAWELGGHGDAENMPVWMIIVASMGVLPVLFVLEWEPYPRIRRRWLLFSNLVLSVFSMLVSKVMITGRLVKPEHRIDLAEAGIGDVLSGLFLGAFLLTLFYIPTRYLFLRQDYAVRHNLKQKLLFWLSFAGMAIVELAHFFTW